MLQMNLKFDLITENVIIDDTKQRLENVLMQASLPSNCNTTVVTGIVTKL